MDDFNDKFSRRLTGPAQISCDHTTNDWTAEIYRKKLQLLPSFIRFQANQSYRSKPASRTR